MSYPLFAFNGPAGQDPTAQAGTQQYLTQGQMGINPGQVQVAASDPISSAGKMDFSGALKAAMQNGPPSLQQQAQQPGGVNMGLFNTYQTPPVQQHEDNPQGMPVPPQQSFGQQIGDYLSRMFGGG